MHGRTAAGKSPWTKQTGLSLERSVGDRLVEVEAVEEVGVRFQDTETAERSECVPWRNARESEKLLCCWCRTPRS